MIPSFLEVTIQDLIKRSKTTDYTVILPSKRAVTFFKKEFAKQFKAATFLPTIISIDEFIERVSKLSLLSNTELTFLLYQVYCNEDGFKEKEGFDDFLKWGTILIQDFNEIDRYLLDEKSFFYYLKNIQ